MKKLVTLNKDITKYGVIESYEVPDDFQGHQQGLLLGIFNPETKEWEYNYAPGKTKEEKDTLLDQIIADKNLLLIEEEVTQLNENKQFVKKIAYHAPYYVEGHSAYMPTNPFENITFSCNVEHTIKYEILLAEEDGYYNRYITLTENTPVTNGIGRCRTFFEIVSDLELTFEEMLDDELDPTIITRATEEGEGYEEDDIIITFYDKTGNPQIISFECVEDILTCIKSVRILSIETTVH